jgi:hypothetical protein
LICDVDTEDRLVEGGNGMAVQLGPGAAFAADFAVAWCASGSMLELEQVMFSDGEWQPLR